MEVRCAEVDGDVSQGSANKTSVFSALHHVCTLLNVCCLYIVYVCLWSMCVESVIMLLASVSRARKQDIVCLAHCIVRAHIKRMSLYCLYVFVCGVCVWSVIILLRRNRASASPGPASKTATQCIMHAYYQTHVVLLHVTILFVCVCV